MVEENLPQRHFVYHKSHTTRPGFEPGPPWWEASDKPRELWRSLIHSVACKTVKKLIDIKYKSKSSMEKTPRSNEKVIQNIMN
jgi:hypothetical protein